MKSIHVGTPKQSTNVTRYKLKRPLLIRFKIKGHPWQFLTYQMLCYYEERKENEIQRQHPKKTEMSHYRSVIQGSAQVAAHVILQHKSRATRHLFVLTISTYLAVNIKTVSLWRIQKCLYNQVLTVSNSSMGKKQSYVR